MARVQVSISIARQDVYDYTVLPAKNTGELNKLISTLLTVYTDFPEVRQIVEGASLGAKRRQQDDIQDLFSKMRETLEVQAEELIETSTSNQAFEDTLTKGTATAEESPEIMGMLEKILSKVEGLYGTGFGTGGKPSVEESSVEEPTGGGPTTEETTDEELEFSLGDSVEIEEDSTETGEETADQDLSDSFLTSLMDSVGM